VRLFELFYRLFNLILIEIDRTYDT